MFRTCAGHVWPKPWDIVCIHTNILSTCFGRCSPNLWTCFGRCGPNLWTCFGRCGPNLGTQFVSIPMSYGHVLGGVAQTSGHKMGTTDIPVVSGPMSYRHVLKGVAQTFGHKTGTMDIPQKKRHVQRFHFNISPRSPHGTIAHLAYRHIQVSAILWYMCPIVPRCVFGEN